MAVLDPLKLVITNYPEGDWEELEAPYYPHDVPLEGSRPVPFSRELFIEADDLKLTRAILYQNGVGYFERRGKIVGDRLTVRIRADQVNDFLKSLTVIDSSKGKAVSVSLPLDRNAARQVMELFRHLHADTEATLAATFRKFSTHWPPAD